VQYKNDAFQFVRSITAHGHRYLNTRMVGIGICTQLGSASTDFINLQADGYIVPTERRHFIVYIDG